MDSMRALADTNIKVSEARVALSNIKEAESKYLAEREQKALLVVDKAIKDSAELLAEAKGNYQQIIDLYRTMSEFSAFLGKEYESFKSLMTEFDERSRAWEAAASKREAAISELRVQIEADKVRIKNDSAAVAADRERLAVDRIKLNDDRGVVERAINRLKENRI